MNIAAQVALLRTLTDDYVSASNNDLPRDARNTAYQMTQVVMALYNAAYKAEAEQARGKGAAL